MTQQLLSTIDRGFIIFMSSYSAISNVPYVGHYAGTKAFITAFTASLRQECPKIDVLAVHPAYVSTALIHNQKSSLTIATPEEAVNGAMKDLGRRGMTIGSWKQSLIHWGLSIYPEFVLDWYMKYLQDEQLVFWHEQRALKTN